MRDLLRNGRRAFFLWASLAALGLRLLFVLRFPGVVDDSRLYANIAENWLQHGIYGVTDSGVIMPTLSRLPGYPAFLAAIFAIFGIDNFRAVLLVQVLFDLGTCFLIADMARRMFSRTRAAQAAFLLAGLCPFLANYAGSRPDRDAGDFLHHAGLGFRAPRIGGRRGGSPGKREAPWLWCGLSVGAGILLRPDGGILLLAIGAYLLWLLLRSLRSEQTQRPSLAAHDSAGGSAASPSERPLPLIPWTLRNLHTLHRFEPLAPRYANDSDEPVMTGFNRWVKTWIADYVSVQEIYWNVPGEDIDVTRLPNRAFDSPQQKRRNRALFADYNRDHDMTPRTRRPLRDPGRATHSCRAASLLRVASSDTHRRHVAASAHRTVPLRPALVGIQRRPPLARGQSCLRCYQPVLCRYVCAPGSSRSREIFGIGLFVLFLLLRSAFLGTLENPEPRYTLECYPVVILLASSLLQSQRATDILSQNVNTCYDNAQLL